MPRRLSPSVSPVLPAGLGYHGPSTSSQYHDENFCRNSDTDNNLLKLTDSQDTFAATSRLVHPSHDI